MKKGFTLTELIAVIIIIGVVLIIAIPSITNLVNKEEDNISESMKKVLLQAGELYVQDNNAIYKKLEGNTYCIKISQLINEEYLTGPLKDPITGKEVSSEKYVKTSIENNVYNYSIVDTCNEVIIQTAQTGNIDITSPIVIINNISLTTDSAIITTNCVDYESGITKYEFSKDRVNWVDNGLSSSYVFSNLKQGTAYTFRVRCTNGVGLTSIANQAKTTKKIKNPEIVQVSQTPSSGTWVQQRVIGITYFNEGISSPKYYYSLDNSTWTEVTGTTKDVTFTANGKLYAKTVDGSGNTAISSTYTVANIDTTPPSLSITNSSSTTNSATITFSANDSESGIKSTTCVYGTSASYGNNGTVSGSNCKLSGLTSNTTYYYKIMTTNGSGLTTTQTGSTGSKAITAPTIAQYSQTPNGTYATKRVIRITYSSANITTPKYYYSLDNSTWIEVTGTTKDVTFTSNGKLYAKTVDGSGNTKTASAYTVTNIDTSAPTLALSTATTTTDSITVPFTASDSESGIQSTTCVYGTSTSYGKTGTVSGSNCKLSGLTSNTTYYYKVTTTNGSGLTTTKTGSTKPNTPNAPTIAQASQTPSSGTYAQTRVIRITYSSANITSPKYYYSTNGSSWTEVTGTTKDVTFTSNGNLYAKTVDGSGNTATASTYTVTNIDRTAPTVTVSVSGKVATFTLKDNIGVVGYGVNQSSTSAPAYLSAVNSTNITRTWTASSAGTFYVWVKDSAGNTNKASFSISASEFNYAATDLSYAATPNCSRGSINANGMCEWYDDCYEGSSCENTCVGDWVYYECESCKRCNGTKKVMPSVCDSVFYSCSGTCDGDITVTCDDPKSINCEYGFSYLDGCTTSCTGYTYYECDSCRNWNSCVTGSTCADTCEGDWDTEAPSSYSCPNGGTLSGTKCIYYTCPNGGTPNYTTKMCEF